MPSSLFIKQYFGSFIDDIISTEVTQDQKDEASHKQVFAVYILPILH